MPRLIVCPPTSGKSFVCRDPAFKDKVVDMDQILDMVIGRHDIAARYIIQNDESALRNFRILFKSFEDRVILSNFDPSSLLARELDIELVLYRSEGDYLKHIRLTGRFDLTAKFDDNDFRNWHQNYSELKSKASRVYELAWSEFVSHVMKDLTNM